MTRKLRIDPAHLIYSAGLYDYLSDRIAAKLTSVLFEALHAGGSLLLANFTPVSYGRGYMEAFMDWDLVYRDEQKLRELAESLPAEDVARVECFEDPYKNVVYAEIVKRSKIER